MHVRPDRTAVWCRAEHLTSLSFSRNGARLVGRGGGGVNQSSVLWAVVTTCQDGG